VVGLATAAAPPHPQQQGHGFVLDWPRATGQSFALAHGFRVENHPDQDVLAGFRRVEKASGHRWDWDWYWDHAAELGKPPAVAGKEVAVLQ